MELDQARRFGWVWKPVGFSEKGTPSRVLLLASRPQPIVSSLERGEVAGWLPFCGCTRDSNPSRWFRKAVCGVFGALSVGLCLSQHMRI